MRKRSSGFALLESLLTFVVLVIGILGATALQGYLTTESGVSKARTEALGLAEDKLEEIRNFALEDEGTYLPADGTDSDVVSGINADFTRSWTIGTTGDIKAVSVDVDWTDQRGEAQTASLQAEFTWNPPGGSGYLVSPPPDSFVPSPSGRASLGEGDLIDFPDALLQSTNTDGTELYQSGSDLLLVDTDEDDESYRRVVLTLKDACETEVCTDFVRIEGEVYIDHSETTRDAEDVFVRASDASFCKRWYIVVPDDPDTLLEDETVISTDMSSAPYTAEAARDADYQYFRYTCYLGGGWHGNIGLLFSGGLAQNDKVCQGDPTSNNSWEDEVLGIRRVYRGFLYERDSSTDSGRKEDADGDTLYYSIGISDALRLDNQDFVITSFATDLTEDVNCKVIQTTLSPGAMMRPDSDTGDGLGTLFQDVPTDFVCLNEDNNETDGLLQDIDQTFESGVLVSYGPRFPAGSADGEFGADTTCPFDPSDPPSQAHTISGAVAVADEAVDPSGIVLTTSDGPDNCSVTSAESSASYTCTVFDWGSGWTGQIKPVHSSVDMVCEPSVASFSDIILNQIADFENCSIGSKVSITLAVDHDEDVVPEPSLQNGSCEYTSAASAAGRTLTTFACTTDVFKETWSGLLTIPPGGSYVCGSDASDGDGDFFLEYTSADAGAPVEMYVTMARNGNGCDPKE